MTDERTSEYLAECFWPGVQEADLRALDERASEVVSRFAGAGDSISYGGSWLMREDEIVFCVFEGSRHSVCEAARQAGIPFERIVETTRSPRPLTDTPDRKGDLL